MEGDDPVVVDPAGRAFVVAADGTLTPTTVPMAGPFGTIAATDTGRRVETECDAGLTTCSQTYVAEDGRRTPLLDASRAVTTGVVMSPTGRHLVVLYPQVSCDIACRFVGSPADPTFGPSSVVDIDSGEAPVVIANTQTREAGVCFSTGGPAPRAGRPTAHGCSSPTPSA